MVYKWVGVTLTTGHVTLIVIWELDTHCTSQFWVCTLYNTPCVHVQQGKSGVHV